MVVEEIGHLAAQIAAGEAVVGLENLGNDRPLAGIRYIKRRVYRHSLRIYVLTGGRSCVLHVDTDKRRTALTPGTKKLLATRARQCRESGCAT